MCVVLECDMLLCTRETTKTRGMYVIDPQYSGRPRVCRKIMFWDKYRPSGSRVEAEWKQGKNVLQHDLTPSISPRHVGNACKCDIYVHTKLT